MNGNVRYFVDGKLASYNGGVANAVKLYDADFANAEGADTLRFDIAKVTNLNVTGMGKTDTAEIVGFQSHEVSDTIRLLSGLDSLYYGTVGVEVKAYQKDGTPYNSKTVVKTTGTLYSSVIADNVPLPASKYGYNYFAAITIDGSFMGYKDSYIIVKPFTIIGNDKYYGEAVRLNILDNGSYEFAENN